MPLSHHEWVHLQFKPPSCQLPSAGTVNPGSGLKDASGSFALTQRVDSSTSGTNSGSLTAGFLYSECQWLLKVPRTSCTQTNSEYASL